MAKTDYYYRFAVGSCVLSALTTVSILIVVPLLCSRASWGRDQITLKSERFRNDANRIWYQMHNGGEAPDYQADNAPAATFFSRPKRSPWDKHVCSECNQLSCPVGMPGPPGDSGNDGQPGNSGASGKAGDDGYDVELEPQDDLPCVICPAGPPGLRGMQGERGTSGQQGTRGNQGSDGKFGASGPRGVPGRSGPIGQRGAVGPQGPPGETIVAGIGIKGPNGPPGAVGPKGPIGRPGKSSREAGPIGPPGLPGPQGNPGAIGRQGDDGNFGAPGEHGEPSAYCHSDCGVSQILAPSVSEMMSHDIHSMGDGSAGYTNTETKQPEVSYNHDVQPVHSVGINDAYSGYMNSGAAAVQVQ